jgi:hypothetical protein
MSSQRWQLDQEHVIDASWWLPENPRKRIAGRFTFKPGVRLELELLGSFLAETDIFEGFFRDRRESKFDVFGKSRNGDLYTLRGCFTRSVKNGQQKIAVDYALAGSRYEASDKPIIDRISIELSNFPTWINGFKSDSNFAEGPEKFRSVSISVSPFVSENACEGRLPYISATVSIPHSITIERPAGDGIHVDYDGYLRIALDRAVSMSRAEAIATRASHLFNLLIGKPTVQKSVWLGDRKGRGGSFLGCSWVRLKPRAIYPHEIACPLTTPGLDFPALLNGWLQLADRVPTSIAILHSVLMKSGTFLETEIVEMLQAIEAYCSETEPFTYLNDTEFSGALGRLLDAVCHETEDFKTRVKGTVQHLNRPSQRSHLTRLLDRLDPTLVGHVVGGEKARSFVSRVVNTRNKISHPQSGSVWDDNSPSDVLEMISRLKLLLVIAMLSSAGMPVDILKKKYDDFRRWQWA